MQVVLRLRGQVEVDDKGDLHIDTAGKLHPVSVPLYRTTMTSSVQLHRTVASKS